MSKKIKVEIIKYYNHMNLILKLMFLVLIIQLMIQLKSSIVQPFIYFQF
jgi:hypothetical protein